MVQVHKNSLKFLQIHTKFLSNSYYLICMNLYKLIQIYLKKNFKFL